MGSEIGEKREMGRQIYLWEKEAVERRRSRVRKREREGIGSWKSGGEKVFVIVCMLFNGYSVHVIWNLQLIVMRIVLASLLFATGLVASAFCYWLPATLTHIILLLMLGVSDESLLLSSSNILSFWEKFCILRSMGLGTGIFFLSFTLIFNHVWDIERPRYLTHSNCDINFSPYLIVSSKR